ncbi:MAG: (2Fe-2S)-binding protein [Thermoplasmata archaeon]|nr:MAG: (2Fe-2S)-binding protein [Thermoplasmata archaeon]
MTKAISVKVKMTINGKEITCEPNLTVLDAARDNGIEIPTLCFNPLFSKHRSGSCRMCLVEVIAGGKPGLQPSCTFTVSSGLVISTISETVYKARRTVVELLISEHVQKCYDCPMSGDCILARFCRDYDVNGVSVCAECPNQKEGCLLLRGVLCMGPITYANCNAYCTRRGYRCEGCHSLLLNENVLRFGLEAYRDAGFSLEEIIEWAEVFSFDGVKVLKKVTDDIKIFSGKEEKRWLKRSI